MMETKDLDKQATTTNVKLEEIANQLRNLSLKEIKELNSEDFETLKSLVDDLLKVSLLLHNEIRIKSKI